MAGIDFIRLAHVFVPDKIKIDLTFTKTSAILRSQYCRVNQLRTSVLGNAEAVSQIDVRPSARHAFVFLVHT